MHYMPESTSPLVIGVTNNWSLTELAMFGSLADHRHIQHGNVDVSGSSHKFRVGERLSVVPQHQGMTINLHSVAYAVRKGLVEAVWPVAGRGQVQ